MCVNCRAFITTNDRVCPYCDAKVGPRAIDVRQPGEILGGLIPQVRFTTVIILLINVALYAATYLYQQNTQLPWQTTLALFGAKLPYFYMRQHHEWWRLITAGFLHGGLMHIAMNMWILFDLGAEVEEIYGTSRLIVFYFVSTVLGFYASALWSPALSIGASAGIFGLIGAMIAFGVTDRSSLGSAVKSLYIRWAIYGFALGLLPFFQTDNAAHLGGLAGGFVAGFLARTPRVRAMWKETLIRALAGICLALTVAAFGEMFLLLQSAKP